MPRRTKFRGGPHAIQEKEATHINLTEFANLLPAGFVFEDMVREIEQADIPWTRHYSEYQSGGWWTCSLLGGSADATHGDVADNLQPTVTDAL